VIDDDGKYGPELVSVSLYEPKAPADAPVIDPKDIPI
jgi:hypothetical protein